MASGAERPTMHIGQLAEETGMSQRTLRHYDDVGVLKPSGRTVGGFRIYTGDDLARLVLIRRMKPLGYSLEEMRQLLATIDELQSGCADDARVRTSLAEFIDEAAERRERLRRQLDMADEFIDLLRRQ